MALVGISWGYDTLGYPYAVMQVRNDTGQTKGLQTLGFLSLSNGVELDIDWSQYGSLTEVNPIPGGWLSGQVRTFKARANTIFNCSKASVTASGWFFTG
jgi:hypothetical protein